MTKWPDEKFSVISPCSAEGEYLQVWDSHSGDHPEHDQEHASDYRLRDGDEDGAELPKEAQDDHEESGRLQDQPASHLVMLITTVGEQSLGYSKATLKM